MIIDTKQIISMTEANQNFSKAAKTVDQYGEAVIMKNNKPKYIIADVNQYLDITDDEKILILAKRILNRHIHAFKELAK
ncbi:MAG: type II toxin-antitoxin system Phd/YefM family antitoxin [Anaeroplasmataceae bacterium]|nr:type II toxin-antitoxin system Phd/YefM family antitoxin [Anaeroplasmataceae bacterium]